MKLAKVLYEKTPFTEADCLTVFSRVKSEFNFPLHTHEVYELNFVQNAYGAQRIVGDSIEIIDELDLVLITGSDLEHAWFTHECKSEKIEELTIQFSKDLFSDTILNKKSFNSISRLLLDAQNGVVFDKKTIEYIKPRFDKLAKENTGFYAIVQLLTILYELSISPGSRVLASTSINGHQTDFDSRRINNLYSFFNENYMRNIKLEEAANVVNMSQVAFCKFMKKHTGRTFVDSLNEIRLGHAVRLLINTTETISEICFACGFNNLSHFNRLFLREKKCTPSELRENYWKNRIII
ncbi:AraC family transcriptional regulator [Dysgonomonas massiliensis]|uniref:AraC family transcriptional regulator n=1 Tax=Dysgonomonas massiliensis TaxID=2040292 RepID=UPI000C76C5D7|nr:AraC family transcriptional regulator [Dysgonomonas massiliensis]